MVFKEDNDDIFSKVKQDSIFMLPPTIDNLSKPVKVFIFKKEYFSLFDPQINKSPSIEVKLLNGKSALIWPFFSNRTWSLKSTRN